MNTIEFKTLGKFYIEISGSTIDAADVLGRQLSSLLAYFVYHRSRIISKDMLIDSFWPESENPNSAIKYAIFRLRNELAKICEYDWIITSKMGYMLNPALEVKVDLDAYENDYRKITESKDLSLLGNVDANYGEFLAEFSDEWILSIREYFNELFNKMIVTVCSDEFEKKDPDYKRLIEVCRKSLDKDPFSETLILYYCKALIETREYNKALTYFEKMSRKFNEELGIPLGDNIRSLFMGDQQTAKAVHIEEIPKEFEEDLIANGPLFCSQLTFKKLYQVYVRKSRRDKANYHIIVFELKDIKGKQTHLHETFENVILDTLRRTDIYTSFVTNNFGLLVEVKNLEDIFVVIDRIQKKFYSKVPSKNARVYYYEKSLNAVDDVNHLPTIETHE